MKYVTERESEKELERVKEGERERVKRERKRKRERRKKIYISYEPYIFFPKKTSDEPFSLSLAPIFYLFALNDKIISEIAIMIFISLPLMFY